MEEEAATVGETAMEGETATEDKEVMANSPNSTAFAVNNKIVMVVPRAAAVEAVVLDRVIVETTPTQSSLVILATAISKVLSRCLKVWESTP
jgi:exosome complex RNA-binding protein Csl4